MRSELLSARLVDTIGRLPAVGPALRWYARRFEEGSVVRIATGHAAGMQWKRHHRYVNGYWTGQYELRIQDALCRHLSKGDTFFDVGANAGFFSLVASRLVGSSGRVYSFEPLPENLNSLREQISINALANCQVIDKAVSDRSGQAMFVTAENNSMGHLDSSAESGVRQGGSTDDDEVETVSIDDFAASHRFPKMIKIDVEGAEDRVLIGAAGLLASADAPVLLIEIHGEAKALPVDSILRSNGYHFEDLNSNALAGAFGQRHVLCLPRSYRAM